MKPEQKEKWQQMRASYLKDTLELRKQLAAKRVELETLWDQPDVDEARIEKLSAEVADLQAELSRKHDKYLMSCHKEFGDKGWACPGMGW
jgi:zinc resistance-associated protein